MRRNLTLSQYADEMPHGWFTRVAVFLGVDVGLVSKWVSGKREIPVARALQLERLTSGRVRADVMRPDVDFTRWPKQSALTRKCRHHGVA